MDYQKGQAFIEESFLKTLLADSSITDISYSGKDIYFLHNYLGRQKSDINVTENEARDFIRQISNLSEKQFSIQNPKLDVSIGKYRINAVHPSIGRRNFEHCLTFSIRIVSTTPIITDKSTFLNAELVSLFSVLLRSKMSIIIGGITGTGKTEFQKYLIYKIPRYSKLIIIDNVLELDFLPSNVFLDISIWQSDEKNKESNIQELVRTALRNNPDYLIVAESRGKEMVDVLNSAMTGHPIITTIHAFDVNSMPSRIARMVMMNDQKQDFDTLMHDIYYNFRFYVYLKRNFCPDSHVERFIQEVAEIDEKGNKNIIYLRKDNKHMFFKIRDSLLNYLDYDDEPLFKKVFVAKR